MVARAAAAAGVVLAAATPVAAAVFVEVVVLAAASGAAPVAVAAAAAPIAVIDTDAPPMAASAVSGAGAASPVFLVKQPFLVGHPAGKEGPPIFFPSSQILSIHWSQWGGVGLVALFCFPHPRTCVVAGIVAASARLFPAQVFDKRHRTSSGGDDSPRSPRCCDIDRIVCWECP